jgi:hypothetical protein
MPALQALRTDVCATNETEAAVSESSGAKWRSLISLKASAEAHVPRVRVEDGVLSAIVHCGYTRVIHRLRRNAIRNVFSNFHRDYIRRNATRIQSSWRGTCKLGIEQPEVND